MYIGEYVYTKKERKEQKVLGKTIENPGDLLCAAGCQFGEMLL